jgi:hypothetical protein
VLASDLYEYVETVAGFNWDEGMDCDVPG